mmetsp:Transcript_101236/g.257487  ORF Transcript_101236/g.257487 Transcript_101236/m.257487 type:complete len:224 (-) Transcript_101236:1347-2018(-)
MVQVLVFKGGPVPEVPRAVKNLGRRHGKVLEAFACRVLVPGQAQQCRGTQRGCQALQISALNSRLVAEPHDERLGGRRAARLQRDWKRTLGAHSGNATVCEQQVQPIRFQALPLLLLCRLSRRLLCGPGGRGHRLRLPNVVVATIVSKLLLESREDEHHLRAVRGIRGTRESIRDSILSNLVQDGVKSELVCSDELCDVLRDRHELSRVGGQRMHPSVQAETQ